MDSIKGKTKKIRFFFAALAIAVSFLLLSKENFFENAFKTIVNPFAKIFSVAGYWLNDKSHFIFSIGKLKKENEKITEDNLRLKSEVVELNSAKKENEILRKELQLAPRDRYELQAAFIIGKDLTKSYELVYLNKGKNGGIEKGMPLIIGNGVLIGRIVEVFHNQSLVELIFSQKNNFSVELENGEKGIVHGEYGTSAVLDMVPQTVSVNLGSAIVSSGLSEKIPGGLLIGYIKDNLISSDQLFQKFSVELPYEIEKIKIVWVLKSIKN